ncbi:MAG TPA: cyclic pyranopterin monophosphate synthase MoaC, partial [Acetobacteraceae bacterium]
MTSAGERFTHFDAAGNAAMVDVSAKPATLRTATACVSVVMRPETLAMIQAGTAKKGDVLGVARLAGIMGAKRTADLIPLCHPLPISAVAVDLVA